MFLEFVEVSGSRFKFDIVVFDEIEEIYEEGIGLEKLVDNGDDYIFESIMDLFKFIGK